MTRGQRSTSAIALTAATLAGRLTVSPAQAVTTTFTGAISDSWHESGNWDHGIPLGSTGSAIVGSGVVAKVKNDLTPAYAGALTLATGARLEMWKPLGSRNALSTNAGIVLVVR